ncbi:MAG: hypothetical protein V1749_00240 [Candidatus Desantisbacteria bacterium]
MHWMGSSPPVIFMVRLTRERKILLGRKIVAGRKKTVRRKIGTRTETVSITLLGSSN